MKALNVLQITIENQTFAVIFTLLQVENAMCLRLLHINVRTSNFELASHSNCNMLQSLTSPVSLSLMLV